MNETQKYLLNELAFQVYGELQHNDRSMTAKELAEQTKKELRETLEKALHALEFETF